MRLEPNPPSDDNDFHEVWWDSTEFVIPQGKPKFQLHEIWQWMGDAPNPGWARPGQEEWESPEDAYREGWRYVRPIKLLDEEARLDGTPPTMPIL